LPAVTAGPVTVFPDPVQLPAAFDSGTEYAVMPWGITREAIHA
jgi:hypothetical protein